MWVLLEPGTTKHRIGDEWDKDHWIEEPDTPTWVSDAFHARVNIDAVPDWKKPPYYPPEQFSFIAALLSSWMIAGPGVVFACIGMGLILISSRSRNPNA